MIDPSTTLCCFGTTHIRNNRLQKKLSAGRRSAHFAGLPSGPRLSPGPAGNRIWRETSSTRFVGARLLSAMPCDRAAVLGGVLTSLIILGLTAPLLVDREKELLGAGELYITRGGRVQGTRNGTRFLSPTFVNAGQSVPSDGTAEGKVLRIDDLCEGVLDCDECPPKLAPFFDVASLDRTILV